MTDKITLELTLDELKLIDKYVELNDETQSVFDKIKVAYPISPVEEAFKDWWGQYPETGTWDNFDKKRWQGFQAGYEFAYAISTAKEVMEKVQEEQKEDIIEKLQKLEEQDPEMLLLRQGKVDIVDYNHRTHYRIEYTDSFSGVYKWFVRKLGEIPFLEEVRDVNVYSPLEELYQKEVVKQKDDYPYKKYTPEETEQSLKEAFREAVKQGVVSSSTKPQTLSDLIYDWWERVFGDTDDTETCIDDLVDRIEAFLPKPQSTAGSQNVYVECTVEGFNDCLNKIKGKLR